MNLLRKATAYEAAMWNSLFRWVLRRPPSHPPGTQTFSYMGVVKPILIAFIVLSAVEVPIFDLIVSRLVPWSPARWIVLGLGVYGLIWMLGLFAMLRLHPHEMGEAGIRIRNGIGLDVTIPWTDIAAVHGRYRSLPSSKGVQIEHDGDGPIVNLGTGGQTSIDIVLHEPSSLDLPKGPSEPTTRVRLYADDKDGFVAAAREHLSTLTGG